MGREELVLPRRVHSPEEFLIFIIHVVREAHVDLRHKSYEREKTNQSEDKTWQQNPHSQ